MREWFSQLAWPAFVGVLAAVLLLNTEWLKISNSAKGPDSYSHAVAVATPSVVNIYTAKLVADRSPVLNAPLSCDALPIPENGNHGSNALWVRA